MKRHIAIPIICFFVISFLFVLGKGFLFYKGKYQAPSAKLPGLEDITVPSPTVELLPEVPEERAGTVLVDLSHENNFSPWEINALLSRVVTKGFAVEFVKEAESEERKEEGAGKAKQVQSLRKKLRFVDAFVVVSPQTSFSGEEIELIKEFVKKGGKLSLIEDPTRRPKGYAYTRTKGIPINDISAEFDLIFENDYLYNLKENEGNYRYVFFRDFGQNKLTKGLKKITLYSTGSISASGAGIVFTDKNTFSSNIETKDKLSPVALAAGSKVLAIYDLTFMIEPYNASFDNNKLISNISDWLTISKRKFILSDFPYFLEKAPLVAYADASLMRQGLELKDLLIDLGKSPQVLEWKEATDLSKDTVFIGLFKNAPKVKKLLETGNIICTDTEIEIKGIGTIPQVGTSIVYLHKEGDNHLMVILADTEERLQETLDLLKSGEFREWLVSDILAIYQPEKEKKPEEGEGGIIPPAP